MHTIKKVFSIVSWLFLGVIGLLILFTISSNSSLLGGYNSYLVQSGSMEPSIMTGDIIVIHPKEIYVKRDVITFHNAEGNIISHRIIDEKVKGNTKTFITKGDANQSEDEGTVSPSDILGAVAFVVPKVGFLVAFAKSIPGLIILIIIPAFTLIFDEIIGLFKRS